MPIDAGGRLGARIAKLLRFAALAIGTALPSPLAHSDVLAKTLTDAARMPLSWPISSRDRISASGVAPETATHRGTLTVVHGSSDQTPEQGGPTVAASQPSSAPPSLPDDLSLLAGISILNDFESEKGLSFGLDFHHPFSRVIDWDVAYLNEGHPGNLRRDGIVSELWLSRRYREDRLVLEFGAGFYVHADTGGEEDAPENSHDLGGIVSLSVRRSLGKKWFLRGTWHRVLGEHEDDTDVVLVGIGHFLRKADHPPPAPAPAPVEPPVPTPEPSPPAGLRAPLSIRTAREGDDIQSVSPSIVSFERCRRLR